jgi:hypothetical protein
MYSSFDLIHFFVIRKATKARRNIVSCLSYEAQYMHLILNTIHFCLGFKVRRREREEMVTFLSYLSSFIK